MRSLAGRWDVINPRSAWLGGPDLTAMCPGSFQNLLWLLGGQTSKCLAWACDDTGLPPPSNLALGRDTQPPTSVPSCMKPQGRSVSRCVWVEAPRCSPHALAGRQTWGCGPFSGEHQLILCSPSKVSPSIRPTLHTGKLRLKCSVCPSDLQATELGASIQDLVWSYAEVPLALLPPLTSVTMLQFPPFVK